jgi:2'-5' RNA ligase
LSSILVFVVFSILSFTSWAQTELTLPTDAYHNEDEIFYSHRGDGPFESALAMSIRYEPFKNLRQQLNKALEKDLDYFRGWNVEGEAHITVVTPGEFDNVLKPKMSMKEIEAIADRYEIQKAKISILGVGSGKAFIDGKNEETYFVIVDSYDLRLIRQMIFYEFTRRGGDRSAFDPTWFFPHITVGFTKRDLHETDGILKNLKYSFDKRFKLKIISSQNRADQ